jgi:hypothetical protein
MVLDLRRAFFRLLRALDHHAVAGFETAFNDPIRADLLADGDGLQMHRVRLGPRP